MNLLTHTFICCSQLGPLYFQARFLMWPSLTEQQRRRRKKEEQAEEEEEEGHNLEIAFRMYSGWTSLGIPSWG